MKRVNPYRGLTTGLSLKLELGPRVKAFTVARRVRAAAYFDPLTRYFKVIARTYEPRGVR